MFNWNKHSDEKTHDIILYAAIASILASLFILWQDELVNNDAYTYIQAARAFLAEGIVISAKEYGWPFYPVLIAGTSQLLGINLVYAAYSLNILLMALVVVAYLYLVKEVYGNNRKLLLIAALVILAQPHLNEYRSYIIRDFGYWAFGLLALVQLIRFNKTGKNIHICGWLLNIGIATLFRFEGALLAVLLPLTLLFNPHTALKSRLIAFLKFNGIFLVLIIFVIAEYELIKHYVPSIHKYSLWVDRLSSLNDDLVQQSQRFAELILNKHSKDYALFMLVTGLLAMLVADIIGLLSIPYSLILLWGLWNIKLKGVNQAARWLVLGCAAIVLTIVTCYMLKKFFIQGRYALLLVLILMVLIPNYLYELLQRYQHGNTAKALQGILLATVLFLFIDSFVSFGYSKLYIKEASDWLDTKAPPNAVVYTNSAQLAFYANRTTKVIKKEDRLRALLQRPVLEADYLALKLEQDQVDLQQLVRTMPAVHVIAAFNNKKGDQVVILKTAAGHNE